MTKLVGILNITPDSFSGDGLHGATSDALARIDTMIEAGASVIDIGAESTRPGADALSWQEEWQRLAPVAESLGTRLNKTCFSIDTRHSETARRALASGFHIVNDVSGGSDAAMHALIKEYDCAYILMHSVTVPADPKHTIAHDTDATEVVLGWAEALLNRLEGQGIKRSKIILDPGIGFGKTPEQSLSLIRSIARLKALGVPVMVGHSRKSFLSLFTGKKAALRDPATLAVSYYLAMQGVDYLRVHDIESHAAMLRDQECIMKHPDDRIEALLSSLASPKLATIDLSLERVAKLLAALGNPQDKLPPVVHVAGTNGKGSLVAYLTAILQTAGYRVHRYTSPYLVRFNENIMLAGKPIDDAYLLELLERVASQVEHYPVTFFEAATAAAFIAFSETPADIILLETGLGGRLDATNMVRTPLVTAITPVSIDHTEYLGDTLVKIAGEKAGIIKPGVPCVVGPQAEEVTVIIERTANNLNSLVFRSGREWNGEKNNDGFYYKSSKHAARFPLPNLAGGHQVSNAATAIAVMDCLGSGFAVTDEHIAAGITHAAWPARLQRISEGSLTKMLPQGAQLWLDGGHNPGAGKVLAEWVRAQKKPVHLICGMLKNKDVKNFLTPLVSRVKSLTAIPIHEQLLSQNPQVISDIAAALGIKSSYQEEVGDAIELIVNKEENDFIILICGSLYLAGNILWQNNKKT